MIYISSQCNDEEIKKFYQYLQLNKKGKIHFLAGLSKETL